MYLVLLLGSALCINESSVKMYACLLAVFVYFLNSFSICVQVVCFTCILPILNFFPRSPSRFRFWPLDDIGNIVIFFYLLYINVHSDSFPINITFLVQVSWLFFLYIQYNSLTIFVLQNFNYELRYVGH